MATADGKTTLNAERAENRATLKVLTEADTCRKFVVPKLQAAGWDNEPHSIAEQRTITDGRIVPVGKGFVRKPSKPTCSHSVRLRSLGACGLCGETSWLNAYLFQMRAGRLLDVFVQAVPVRVHRDDRGKVFHGEMPHRFGRAELQQRHAVDARDRARVELRRPADRVEVNGTVPLQRAQRPRAHATF